MARVAPTIVGVSALAAWSANTTSFTLTIPTVPGGLQVGDVLVVAYRNNLNTSPVDYSSPGFVRRSKPFDANSASIRVSGLQMRAIDPASTSLTSVTFTGTEAPRGSARLLVVRGVDLTVNGGIAGESLGYTADAATLATTPWTFSINNGPALVLAMSANEVISPNSTTPISLPTGFTTVMDGASPVYTKSAWWVGQRVMDAGTFPPGTITIGWQSSGSYATYVLAFVGKEEVVPEPEPGATVEVVRGGALVTGRVFVVRDGIEVPATRLQVFRHGIPSAEDVMASTSPMTMGHRGASGVAGMPEMSARGYDYCAERGHPLLEFSANQTSDGVFVGCHDASLNRTSQTSGLPDLINMTWSQVQAYQNTLNSAGSPAPYYRLDEFLDKWTTTHVVVVDPKYSGVMNATTQGQFFAVLDAHGGPDKIIVKWVGAGASSLAAAGRARGYVVSAYFYETNVTDGSLASNQGNWDMLGMEYNASTSAWNAVTSYGKPVVGHICPTQAAANTAVSRGAKIIQSSGVDVIAPLRG